MGWLSGQTLSPYSDQISETSEMSLSVSNLRSSAFSHRSSTRPNRLRDLGWERTSEQFALIELISVDFLEQ